MKIATNKILIAFLVSLGIGVVVIALTDSGHAQSKVSPVKAPPGGSEAAATVPTGGVSVRGLRSGAPVVVQDPGHDSPGTNLVTRVVTFTAEVVGAAPVAVQWKLDRGAGFADIPGATNLTYRIGNAQVEHSGRYALFATNALGGIATTPVPLIVIEGED